MKTLIKHPIIPFVLFLIVGFAIYSMTFDDEFIFDSFTIISDQYHIQDISYYLDLQNWKIYNRPLANLTLSINFYYGSSNVVGYMLVNILLHVISTFLVFLLSKKMFASFAVSKPGGLKMEPGIFAIFVALLFLVHPLQTQSVTYIIQRMNTLASMFVLVAVLFYWNARILQVEKRRIGLSMFLLFLAVVTGLLGLFSKQNAVIFPGAFFLIEVLFIRTGSPRIKNVYLSVIGGLIVLAILFLIIVGMIPEETDLISRKDYFLTQSRVLIRYMSLMIFPWGQNLDYDFVLSSSILDYKVILSALGLLVCLLCGFFALKKNRLVSFAIFWFFLALSIESSLIPIRDVINEHRCYLAVWSYSILLVVFVDYLFRNRSVKYVYIVLSLCILIYAGLTINRNRVWDTNYSLWQDVVKKSPKKARPWNNLGYATLMIENRPDEAIGYLETAISLDTTYAKAYNNLGMAWKEKGDLVRATGYFHKAVEYLRIASILNNLGCVLILNGQSQEALEYLLEAIENAPNDYSLNYNIGVAYQQVGDTSNAIGYYQNTLKIAPGYRLAEQKLEKLLDKGPEE